MQDVYAVKDVLSETMSEVWFQYVLEYDKSLKGRYWLWTEQILWRNYLIQMIIQLRSIAAFLENL